MKLRTKLIGLALALMLGGLTVGCASQKDITPSDGIVSEGMEQTDSVLKEEEQAETVQPEEEVKEEIKEETKEEIKEEDEIAEKPGVKPEVKPEENKPVAKPEVSKPVAKPEVNKPTTKPEQTPAIKPEVNKPETKPQGKPEVSKPEVEPEEVTLSANEIVDKIIANVEIPASMNMDEQMLADTYGIDPSLLQSYYIKMPMMIVHASEVAVFELKNGKDTSKVLDGINKRYEQLYQTWSTYLPDQFELVQNYKTAQKGNYVLFVISEAADTIVSNFNNLVK